LRIQPKNPTSFVSSEQLHLLETFARQVTLAIEVDRLQEEVRSSQLEIEVKGLRSILLNSISRELQIPLSDIQKLLKRIIEDLGKVKMQESADVIQKYATQLNRLIDHLVQTLQFEAGLIELKRDAHSLEKIIQTALTKSEKFINLKPILLHIPSDLPAIPCDRILLIKAIVNLIENAAKYTPSDTPLDITAKLKDNFVEVSIADQGKGIAMDDIERIFDKFYRGQTPPESTGAGLGLFICRSIIQLHAGRIWVESRVGGGSVFKFVLPVK
jgi:two-component system sensor histidine kinase KdpD